MTDEAFKRAFFQVPGVLTTFSARQSELIRMVKFVSQKTGAFSPELSPRRFCYQTTLDISEVFCSVSTAFAALASANTIYMLAGLVRFCAAAALLKNCNKNEHFGSKLGACLENQGLPSYDILSK